MITLTKDVPKSFGVGLVVEFTTLHPQTSTWGTEGRKGEWKVMEESEGKIWERRGRDGNDDRKGRERGERKRRGKEMGIAASFLRINGPGEQNSD